MTTSSEKLLIKTVEQLLIKTVEQNIGRGGPIMDGCISFIFGDLHICQYVVSQEVVNLKNSFNAHSARIAHLDAYAPKLGMHFSEIFQGGRGKL